MEKEWFRFGNTFCPYPFLHQHIDVRKNSKLCCHTEVALDTNHDFNSSEYKKIRQRMLDNQSVSACQTCYDKESRGEISQRQICLKGMQRHADLLTEQIKAHKSNQEIMPYWYDLRYSNNCNLQCKMCSPENSSSIAKSLGAFKPYMTNELNLEINPSSIRFYMAGGEPFLIKKFSKDLSGIDNKDCEVIVNTNGTVINNSLINELSRFTNVSIIVSLDGFSDINDKIRIGSKWTDIDKNIDLFISKGWTVCATTVIQKDNVNHLLALLEYLESKDVSYWICNELWDKPDLVWSMASDIKPSVIKEILSMPLVNTSLHNTQLFNRILEHATHHMFGDN